MKCVFNKVAPYALSPKMLGEGALCMVGALVSEDVDNIVHDALWMNNRLNAIHSWAQATIVEIATGKGLNDDA